MNLDIADDVRISVIGRVVESGKIIALAMSRREKVELYVKRMQELFPRVRVVDRITAGDIVILKFGPSAEQ